MSEELEYLMSEELEYLILLGCSMVNGKLSEETDVFYNLHISLKQWGGLNEYKLKSKS